MARLIRDAYRAEVNIRIKLGESGCGAITSLPERKRGPSKLLEDDIDDILKQSIYLAHSSQFQM